MAAAVWMGAGWVVVGAACAGMVLWAWHNRVRLPGLAPWLLVVVPFAFYVLSLWTGQAALRLDTRGGQSMFNLRYGVEVVPGLAVFTALGASVLAEGRSGAPSGRRRHRAVLVVACVRSSRSRR